MKFDHEKFLEACGDFNDSQREGMDALLTFFENDENMTDIRWISYCLATVGRECAGTWKPVSEYGEGKGKPYGLVDSRTGEAYYGRGYVQLTWKSNYQVMGECLGYDLLNNPGLALVPEIAYKIMSYGMRNGSFTGASLVRYIDGDECDYVNARKIINGTDHAEEIAQAAQWFQEQLRNFRIS